MTIDLSLLPDGGVSWLDASGDHADIVLSTRIRLARNVEGYAFTTRARDGERLRVLSQVRDAAQEGERDRVRGLVHVGVLDAHAGEVGHVEEAAIPDLP